MWERQCLPLTLMLLEPSSESPMFVQERLAQSTLTPVVVSQPLPGVIRDAARATPKVDMPETSDPEISVSKISVPKISVVVPTFNPGELLNRVVRSLETQTMPAEDFEVIFVDDGSPDDTWQQLENIRDTHSNVRIERIEHSGWPSKPRNVGLELSQGEYVLFMDHDDELYPRAL